LVTRYLLLSCLFTAVVLQNPSPRPLPQQSERRPPNQESQSTQQQTDTEKRGSEQSPLVIKILPSVQTETESQHNDNEGINKPRGFWGLSDRIAVIATVVAFLQFTALVCTVLVMVLTGRRQLRAYVLPEAGSLYDGTTLVPPQPAKTNFPFVSLTLKNSGQTPAYRVTGYIQIAVTPVANEDAALILQPVEERFSLTLGSGTTFHKSVWLDRALAANEIADIATGVRAIYMYGRIEYRDAFNKRRFVNIRLHYTGVYPPVGNPLLLFSQKGNGAN
jgi:hypothetical protein